MWHTYSISNHSGITGHFRWWGYGKIQAYDTIRSENSKAWFPQEEPTEWHKWLIPHSSSFFPPQYPHHRNIPISTFSRLWTELWRGKKGNQPLLHINIHTITGITRAGGLSSQHGLTKRVICSSSLYYAPINPQVDFKIINGRTYEGNKNSFH